jgi:hypothetical protein
MIACALQDKCIHPGIPRTRYTISKSKMISRRQGRGDAGPPRRIEEVIDFANKDSALI